MLSFHVFANQNPRRSTSLAPAVLRPRRFRHNDEKLVTRPNFRPLLSYVCAFFHFPYPVTPVFACPPWRATFTKTAGCVPTIPILELNALRSAHSILVLSFHPLMNCSLFSREKQSLSFHALTNCPFSIPFVLTFMHRMGGVGGTPNIQTCQHSNLARIFISRRPDRKHNPLAPPERRKEIQQLFPRPILFVQQLHPALRFRARHDFGSCFRPIAQQLSACGARRNSHPRIVADPFHFSRNADRVHEKFRVARIETRRRVRRKPYRRLHALAAFLECFEVQILVFRKRLKSHRLAPSNSMQGILRRTQKSRTDIPVRPIRSRSPFMRTANTKSAPIQPERPWHDFEKVSYFVRTYVTSSVNESFWSLRNVQVVLK